MRYVDDVLVVVPDDVCLGEKLEELNAVEEKIQSTVERGKRRKAPIFRRHGQEMWQSREMHRLSKGYKQRLHAFLLWTQRTC